VCGPGCGIIAHVKDGVLVKTEPGDFPGNRHICARGLAYPKWVYHPDRLKYPLKRAGQRGEGKWERISWDEALDLIARKLNEIGAAHSPASRAWVVGGGALGSLTAAAIMGFAGACGGTFILPLGIGDSAGPSGDRVSYGTLLAHGERYTVAFEPPRTILVWGNNPAETDSFKWHRLRRAKDRGARVIVIDPIFTPTAAKADEYIPIKPGTDAALALAMIHTVLKNGLEDREFLMKHTVAPFLVRTDTGLFLREKDLQRGGKDQYLVWDTLTARPHPSPAGGGAPALSGVYALGNIECKTAFQLLAERAEEYPPEKAAHITGIPAETIERLAIEYATRKPAASYRGMGLQRTFHGDLVWRAITALAAVTGNISFEGYGGFEPNYLAFMTRGVPNFLPILNLYDAVLTGKPFPIKFLWMARNNFVNQVPNFNRVLREILPRTDFIVAAEMFMSVSAQYADIVLPACSFFECSDVITPGGQASNDHMQLQEKAIEPLYESKSDYAMLAALARRMGMTGFMEESEEEAIERVLASGHPTMEGITLERLRQSPVLPAHPYAEFRTPSGKLEFYAEQLKAFGEELPLYREPLEGESSAPARKYPLSFFSTHTRYRVHSQFANVPWARALDPEPALNINPQDAAERGIRDGDIVQVFNDRGSVKLKARVNAGIRPGLVNVTQGWSPWDYLEGTHQALTHEIINPAQQAVYEPNAALYDVRVEVRKEGAREPKKVERTDQGRGDPEEMHR